MNRWKHTAEFQISSADTDVSRECRLSALFTLLQTVEEQHARLLEMDVDGVKNKYNAHWMALRVRVFLRRPPLLGETLKLSTTIRAPKKNRLHWDCDFYIGEEWIGEATNQWVLVSRETGKTLFLEGIPEFPDADPPGSKTITLSRIEFPEETELFDNRRIYYSDTDINGHVNNARYADLACDAAQLNLRPKGVFMQEILLCYIGQCFAGEVLPIYRGKKDGCLYFHGTGPDGSDRFDCRIRMSSEEGL